jgi:hypothetical protein
MAEYRINTDKLVRPNTYAKELGINKQKMNYWIKNNLITVRKFDELDLLLVERGTQTGIIKKDQEVLLPVERPVRSNHKTRSKMKRGLSNV